MEVNNMSIIQIYSQYQSILKTNNLVDYNDMITMTVSLFKQYPHILQRYQNMYSHILVDEFQDINR